MKSLKRSLLLILLLFFALTPAASADMFIRGDSNSDGVVDPADVIRTLSYLFLSGAMPGCLDAADADNDGTVKINDAIYTLTYLYLGGPFKAHQASDGNLVPSYDYGPMDTLDCQTPLITSRTIPVPQTMMAFHDPNDYFVFLQAIQNSQDDQTESMRATLNDILEDFYAEDVHSVVVSLNSAADLGERSEEYPLLFTGEGNPTLNVTGINTTGAFCSQTIELTSSSVSNTEAVAPAPEPNGENPVAIGTSFGCCEYQSPNADPENPDYDWFCLQTTQDYCPPGRTTVLKDLKFYNTKACNFAVNRCEGPGPQGCCQITCKPITYVNGTDVAEHTCFQTTEADCSPDADWSGKYPPHSSPDAFCDSSYNGPYVATYTSWSGTTFCDQSKTPPLCEKADGGNCAPISLIHSDIKLGLISNPIRHIPFGLDDHHPVLDPDLIPNIRRITQEYDGMQVSEMIDWHQRHGLICTEENNLRNIDDCESLTAQVEEKDCTLIIDNDTDAHAVHIISSRWDETTGRCIVEATDTGNQGTFYHYGYAVPGDPLTDQWSIDGQNNNIDSDNFYYDQHNPYTQARFFCCGK